ncbi:MAG: dockerin type I repeat-containing protein [Clostridia bacterium]|nr:dockerin type I repeat-containing protein [Clostridia bacterium]
MLKRIFSVVLALVMVMGAFAMNASAADEVIYGDVTGEGKVNSQDALTVLQVATGLSEITNYKTGIADTNADGKINSSDALKILQLATGNITSFNKSYDNTLKAKYVDPVFAHGAFTFNVTMTDESVGEFDMVFSTDGKAKVIATIIMFMEIVPVEVRMLHRDGKNYQVVPSVSWGLEKAQGSYCEIEDDIGLLFDNYVMLFTTEMIYGSTTKKTVDGVKYDCETFYNENNACFEFYFNGNELELLVVSNGDTVQTFDVSHLEKGADASRLVIPSDCVYDESLVTG